MMKITRSKRSRCCKMHKHRSSTGDNMKIIQSPFIDEILKFTHIANNFYISLSVSLTVLLLSSYRNFYIKKPIQSHQKFCSLLNFSSYCDFSCVLISTKEGAKCLKVMKCQSIHGRRE